MTFKTRRPQDMFNLTMNEYYKWCNFFEDDLQYDFAISLLEIHPTAILTYGELNNDPPNLKFLIPGNWEVNLHGKGGFAEVIK